MTKTLAEVQKEHILKVMEECGGNLSKAAVVLDINRRTIQRMMSRDRKAGRPWPWPVVALPAAVVESKPAPQVDQGSKSSQSRARIIGRGMCPGCGREPLLTSSLGYNCLIKQRERMRARQRAKAGNPLIVASVVTRG